MVVYFFHTAVHCNLSQNGIDHQMCPEDMTSQLEEEEESVDAGAVLLDDDSPGYQDVSPPMYQRRSPPHRSVSESELTRVREVHLFMSVQSTHITKDFQCRELIVKKYQCFLLQHRPCYCDINM